MYPPGGVLNHYPRHIGDWLRDTAHLSEVEECIYSRCVDQYYSREKPLPLEIVQCARLVRAVTAAARKALATILPEFFTKQTDGWHQKRCDEEIEKFKDKSSKATASAHASVESRRLSNAQIRSERMRAAKEKGTHTREEWLALVDFCGAKCVKCGADRPLDRDHIKPIYQGGSDSIDNIQPLCAPCNASKGPENKDWRPLGWDAAVVAASAQRPLSVRSANQNQEPVTKSQEPEPSSDVKRPQLKSVTPAAPSTAEPKANRKHPETLSASGAEAWDAYAFEYAERYGASPVRNALVNSQISALVKRIGSTDAPGVIQHYLRSNNRFYVSNGHSAGILLKHCEQLRTEWATGNEMTESQARQIDKTAGTGNVFKKLIKEADGEN